MLWHTRHLGMAGLGHVGVPWDVPQDLVLGWWPKAFAARGECLDARDVSDTARGTSLSWGCFSFGNGRWH